jgi:hypothetical protein
MKAINKIILSLTLITVSCTDVFEVDISNDSVEIVSPMPEYEIASNVANFSWKSLEGAKKYRVKVVDVNNAILLDSLVSKTTLKFPLSIGDYRWNVRGENFGYQSMYSQPTLFHVIESLDIKDKQVILNKPVANLFVNNGNLTFEWEVLDVADNYEIVITNESNNNAIVYQKSNLINTSEVLTSTVLNQDAKYLWKVRAKNSSGYTQFSTRNFSIDTVVPNMPINSLPANNSDQTINTPINFTWSPATTDTGVIQSPLKIYTIEFSNSNTFSTIILSKENTTTSLTQSFSALGDYYWRVKVTDLALNSGAFSAPFKFTVK